MRDISDANDIKTLVEHFYGKVMNDPIIGFLFTDIAAIDLEHHLPKISAFWSWQLLGIPGYSGRTFEKHVTLNQRATMNADHFHRWLYLFTGSVDALFAGPVADAAKLRAGAIAKSMQQALASRSTGEAWEGDEALGVQLFVPVGSPA